MRAGWRRATFPSNLMLPSLHRALISRLSLMSRMLNLSFLQTLSLLEIHLQALSTVSYVCGWRWRKKRVRGRREKIEKLKWWRQQWSSWTLSRHMKEHITSSHYLNLIIFCYHIANTRYDVILLRLTLLSSAYEMTGKLNLLERWQFPLQFRSCYTFLAAFFVQHSLTNECYKNPWNHGTVSLQYI